MAKFCEKCGNALEENSKFCTRCGEKINIVEERVDHVSKSSKILGASLPKKKNGNFNWRKRIIIAMVGLLGSGYLFWQDYHDAVNEHPVKQQELDTEKSVTNQPNNNIVAKEKIPEVKRSEQISLVLADFTLGDVMLGASQQKVQQVKGEPIKKYSKDGKLYYEYQDITIVFVQNSIKEIWTDNGVAETKRKIRSGVTLDAVKQAYGNQFVKTNYDNLMLYEYRLAREVGSDYVLRFAINSSNKVDYISVRSL